MLVPCTVGHLNTSADLQSGKEETLFSETWLLNHANVPLVHLFPENCPFANGTISHFQEALSPLIARSSQLNITPVLYLTVVHSS